MENLTAKAAKYFRKVRRGAAMYYNQYLNSEYLILSSFRRGEFAVKISFYSASVLIHAN
jgi:hypothetical protein